MEMSALIEFQFIDTTDGLQFKEWSIWNITMHSIAPNGPDPEALALILDVYNHLYETRLTLLVLSSGLRLLRGGQQ